jgi:hypothetical protein
MITLALASMRLLHMERLRMDGRLGNGKVLGTRRDDGVCFFFCCYLMR